MKTLPVEIRFVGNHTTLPAYKTAWAAGADLIADITSPISLMAGEARTIPTGVAINLLDPDYAVLLMSRSGLGTLQIKFANSVGLLDPDFLGEIGLIVENTGNNPHTINPKDRLGQMVIIPKVRADFTVVETFSTTTERGEKGFGSTGISGAVGYEG